jgi:hypothetical protein
MKKIVLKTNYNHKLDCAGFVHIAPAPPTGVPESKMNQVYTIATEDDSHPPVNYKLIDFIRVALKNVRSVFTIPSHGVECDSFILQYVDENPETSLECPMAVYFYVRDD